MGCGRNRSGDSHQPSNTIHGHHCAWWLKQETTPTKHLCLSEVRCDNTIPRLRLCWYPRCRTSKKKKRRRKIHFFATNERQEKAGGKAEEAHFTYITLHKCFTLTNAEVDGLHPIIIRLPAVDSLSGCCIFPSQMLTQPTSMARHIAKCHPPPHPRLLEQASDIIAAPLFASRSIADYPAMGCWAGSFGVFPLHRCSLYKRYWAVGALVPDHIPQSK